MRFLRIDDDPSPMNDLPATVGGVESAAVEDHSCLEPFGMKVPCNLAPVKSA